MRVSEAMTPEVKLTSPEETIKDAAALMAEIDAGILPVADGDRLVGMITDRDIALRAVARGLPPTTPVGEVMSREVLYCFDDEDVDDVADNLSTLQVRRLPVMSRDKRLVGIISLADIAQNGNASTVGEAVSAISEPGGKHTQSLDGSTTASGGR